jgi:hypothetical protein
MWTPRQLYSELGPLSTLALKTRNDHAHTKFASPMRPSCLMHWIAGRRSCSCTASACAHVSCPFWNLQRKRMCLDQMYPAFGTHCSEDEMRWPFTSMPSHYFGSKALVAASRSCNLRSFCASRGYSTWLREKSCSKDLTFGVSIFAFNKFTPEEFSRSVVLPP